MANHPDIQMTYRILCSWAKNGKPKTYGELSSAYFAKTGVSLSPHGTWDETLGDINRRLEKTELPPLSGVVVLQGTDEPGGGFWGCCKRTTRHLSTADARLVEYAVILKEIYAAKYPVILP